MTDEERYELTDWLAVNALDWKHLRDSDPPTWEMQDGELRTFEETSFRLFDSTHDPKSFSEIKREIERRGWIWQLAYNFQEGGYDFGIFNPADSMIHSLDGEKTEVARILAIEHAETEEVAGCLAFKAAVEATTK